MARSWRVDLYRGDLKAGKRVGSFGPYSRRQNALQDAQRLADQAGRGVKVVLRPVSSPSSRKKNPASARVKAIKKHVPRGYSVREGTGSVRGWITINRSGDTDHLEWARVSRDLRARFPDVRFGGLAPEGFVEYWLDFTPAQRRAREAWRGGGAISNPGEEITSKDELKRDTYYTLWTRSAYSGHYAIERSYMGHYIKSALWEDMKKENKKVRADLGRGRSWHVFQQGYDPNAAFVASSRGYKRGRNPSRAPSKAKMRKWLNGQVRKKWPGSYRTAKKEVHVYRDQAHYREAGGDHDSLTGWMLWDPKSGVNAELAPGRVVDFFLYGKGWGGGWELIDAFAFVIPDADDPVWARRGNPPTKGRYPKGKQLPDSWTVKTKFPGEQWHLSAHAASKAEAMKIGRAMVGHAEPDEGIAVFFGRERRETIVAPKLPPSRRKKKGKKKA